MIDIDQPELSPNDCGNSALKLRPRQRCAISEVIELSCAHAAEAVMPMSRTNIGVGKAAKRFANMIMP